MNEELNMKSYKEAVKSYRDLDKEIILNAPEGAMWWHTAGKFYYRLSTGKMEYIDLEDGTGWQLSQDYPHLCAVQCETSYLVPLPNIEIPWEATEDSMGGGKCPVPDDTMVKLLLYPERVNGWSKALPANTRRWNGSFTAYKIIDEDYLPSEQEDDIVSYKLPLYTNAEPLPCGNPLVELATWPTKEEVQEKALIKRLEFLQNLANKFPEIRSEVIKFMECELDGYMNTLWEKDNEE
jgi:hypothetical protein